jgi:hypothetical protein
MMLMVGGCVAWAARAEDTHSVRSVAPARARHERLVSPRVAAMLSDARPKIEAPPLSLDSPKQPDPEQNPPVAIGVEPVLKMAPVVVTGSYSWKRLIDSVAQQQKQPKKPRFSLKDGGTILKAGPAALKFKYDARHGGFDILDLNF